ncbi:MAG: YibE/F family protein [Microgenomates group bacterium]
MNSYSTGTVETVLEQQEITTDESQQTFFTQKVEVLLDETGERVTIPVGTEFQPLNEQQLLKVGSKVITTQTQISDGEMQTVISDVYRLPIVWGLLGLFLVAVIAIARWQGFRSILGMILSIGILVFFIIPQLLSGADPFATALFGSLLIGASTIYLSHGVSIKSHIALGSLAVILAVVAMLSTISVSAAQLVGLGSEEAYFLQFGETSVINLQGLLLGGIVLGALGVLDDITVSQVSVVFQLKFLKKKISGKELYSRGLSVGKDHVASLVNTLVLAYAGANLPLFLLVILDPQTPLWVILNSQVIVEEIVRTLVGSIGLVLAVPLTTAVCVAIAERLDEKQLKELADGHFH